MTTIQIPAVIRPALKAELFGANDVPFRNAVYFIKKHHTNEFQGVLTVHDEINPDEFIHRYIFNELHVIVTEGEGFCFLLNLRLGNRSDVVDGEFLRGNYSYYVLEPDNVVDGPNRITTESDPVAINELIKSKSLYVVAENQSFNPYELQKSA
jgi:hypothetical protein